MTTAAARAAEACTKHSCQLGAGLAIIGTAATPLRVIHRSWTTRTGWIGRRACDLGEEGDVVGGVSWLGAGSWSWGAHTPAYMAKRILTTIPRAWEDSIASSGRGKQTMAVASFKCP